MISILLVSKDQKLLIVYKNVSKLKLRKYWFGIRNSIIWNVICNFGYNFASICDSGWKSILNLFIFRTFPSQRLKDKNILRKWIYSWHFWFKIHFWWFFYLLQCIRLMKYIFIQTDFLIIILKIKMKVALTAHATHKNTIPFCISFRFDKVLHKIMYEKQF